MSDAKTVVVLQRELQAAEVERLRLVGELDAMRERAEQAEARLVSISGVTREELVAAAKTEVRDAAVAICQRLREDGESDMRSAIHAIRAIPTT